jgi:8-oxo-dGTP pyrophosphatase MutT (NUDIX family)
MEKKKIIAAGGLVYNEHHELLMIFRRGKWDLPKGKLDDGETIEACALREVMEETGVKDLELGSLVGKTYHEYFDKWVGEEVIKETWWYSMKATSTVKLIPQTSEDIEAIEWANATKVEQYLQNTYGNIVEIVHKNAIAKKQ